MSKHKELNPKQAKFLEVYAETLSRVDAYMLAYGCEDRGLARHLAYQLINTNSHIKQKIDAMRDASVQNAKDLLKDAGNEIAEMYVKLARDGTPNDNVRLRAIKGILGCIGVEQPKQIEHSGTIKVSLIDLLKEAREGNDEEE